MPQVPAPATDEGIVRKQGIPGARVSVSAPKEAFGGGTADVIRAAVSAGEQINKIAQEEKKKADDVATMEAYTKTVQLRNRLVYDPKTGAMNRRGKDAFGVGEEYGQQFQQGADEIEATLQNDEQRAMYKKIREQETRDLDGTLTRHTFTEAKTYDDETTKSAIAATREDAIMNYQNPEKLQRAMNMQKSLIMAQAERNGVSPEVAKQQLMDAESKTHEAVINRMLANGQDLAASSYYKQVKPSMLGSDSAQVEGALQEGMLRGESQRQAMAIAEKNTSLSAALAEVDKIKDPKIQDATRERVKQRFHEIEEAQTFASRQNFNNAYNIVEKDRRLDAIPVPMWNAMLPQQREEIKRFLTKDSVSTDWNEYYNLKQMAASPALRDKFLQTDLMMYRSKLGDGEFKELVNAQADAKKGDNSTLDGFRTDQQIVNDSLAEIGIDPSPKYGSDDAKKVNLFRRRVDEEVKRWQERTGKKATNEEMQTIVDALAIEGVTKKGFFWDTKKRLFELDPKSDDKFEFKREDIPPVERKRIESALRAQGIEPTEDRILVMYGRKLSGMVKKRGG